MTIGIATDGYIGSFGSGGPGAVITSTDPIVGETIEQDTPIVLVVESPQGGVSVQEVMIRYVGGLSFTSIYTQADGWIDAFSGSTLNLLDGVATLTIIPDDGWSGGVAEFQVEALDNAASDSFDVAGSWWLDVDGLEGGDGVADPIPVEVTPVDEPVVDVVDHVEVALRRLPQQFRGLIDG